MSKPYRKRPVLHTVSKCEADPAESLLEGCVWRKSRGYYFVRADDHEYLCRISNRLRKQLVFPETDAGSNTRRGVVTVKDLDVMDPVAVGDRVLFVDAGGGTGSIKQILPRANKFSRLTQRGRPLEQVIAANIDQVIAVIAAARPTPRWDMLDRMLIEAELLDLPARIVITKMDIADTDDLEDPLKAYEKIGYPITLTCAVTGEGIEQVRRALTGKSSVLVGESGVGKSSLLNALQPGLDRRVGEVRENKHGRGRHTTTMLEMIQLDIGGAVIDTPGINEMGIYNPDTQPHEPAWYFREMRPLLGQCQFGSSCSHIEEPGCAIKQAVESGEIPLERYEGFLSLRPVLMPPS